MNYQQKLHYAKRTAFYAYLELCNATKTVPEKKLYDMIDECEDTAAIEIMTQMIEKGHGIHEKELKRELNTMLDLPLIKEKKSKKSFLAKFFKC